MSHSITEEMRFRQRLCEYAKKYRRESTRQTDSLYIDSCVGMTELLEAWRCGRGVRTAVLTLTPKKS